jgi:hypothetical protein
MGLRGAGRGEGLDRAGLESRDEREKKQKKGTERGAFRCISVRNVCIWGKFRPVSV